jgi:hypothetical protein
MYLAGDMGRGISDAFKQVEQATRGITSGTFTVTKDNVLAAGRIIESQADALQNLWEASVRDMRIKPPGSDDVSVRMAKAWNDLLIKNDDSYKQRVQDYMTGLRKLAVQLGDTAKAYGYTEGEIEAVFGSSRG